MKYADVKFGFVEAVLNKLGGVSGAERFLRGEITVSEPARSWIEKDGVIYLSLTSNGMTGPEWIAHFEKKGDLVGYYAKQLLCRRDFRPTNGVTYQVAVIKGMVYNDRDLNAYNIRKDADGRKLSKPNTEIACLIRDKFMDAEIEAMGLIWIITMHESINDSAGRPSLLSAGRGDGGRCLGTDYDGTGHQWHRGSGFAFVVSQVSAQS